MRLNCRTFSINTTSLSSRASTYSKIAINSGNNENSKHSYFHCKYSDRDEKEKKNSHLSHSTKLSFALGKEEKKNMESDILETSHLIKNHHPIGSWRKSFAQHYHGIVRCGPHV